MSENKKLVPKRRFKEFQDTNAWEQRKLGEVAEVKTGPFGSTLHAEDYVEDGMPIITTEHFKSGELPTTKCDIPQVSKTDYTRLKSYLLEKNDIVFSRVGSVDVNALVSKIQDGWLFSGRVLRVRPQKNIAGQFLHYELDTTKVKNDVISRAVGQTMPSINTEILRDTNVYISKSMQEQTAIGNFFRTLDDAITLHQRKLEKTKVLKAAYLSEMFPAEGERKPKRRFKGFTDAWEQRKLSEIATMKARIGWQGLTQKEFLDNGDYYLITGTDFVNGEIDFEHCYYIGKDRYDQDINIQIKSDDVLITKDGTIGKVAYIKDLDKPATLNAGVFVVRGNDKSICNLFLYHYLAAPYLLDYADKEATGGTIKHLNQNVLVNFPIPLAKFEEQQKIAQFFSGLDNLLTLHQRKLEKLQNLKKAYLNEMFVGGEQ